MSDALAAVVSAAVVAVVGEGIAEDTCVVFIEWDVVFDERAVEGGIVGGVVGGECCGVSCDGNALESLGD